AGCPRALDLSPDGRLLIAGAEDNDWIFAWDLAVGGKPTILFELYNSEPFPLAVRYSARDETILAAGSNGRLLDWDRRSRKLRDREPARFGESTPVAFEAWLFRSGTFYAGGIRLATIRRERGLLAVDIGSG